jgi:hypothetical protein
MAAAILSLERWLRGRFWRGRRCAVCLWRRWGDSDAAPQAQFPGGECVGGDGDGRHGVALALLAWDDGGARGAPPRPKLSTMIMRPPQQGHGGR